MRSETTIGGIYTFASFLLWGLLPLYWQLFSGASSWEVLMHRIIWGSVLLLLVVSIWPQKRQLLVHFLRKRPTKQLLAIVVASCAISGNWVLFIWAIQMEQVVEASLGMYIVPLLSMLIGILVLKERAQRGTWLAIVLACGGVLVMAIDYGHMPWLALMLAATSGIYGLAKKFVHVDAVVEMCLESAFSLPIAVGCFLYVSHTALFFSTSLSHAALCIGAGLLTVLPLLWFTQGVKRLSLVAIGFFQYLSPTLTFLTGLFFFHNTVPPLQWLAFSFIWLALLCYSFVPIVMRRQKMIQQ